MQDLSLRDAAPVGVFDSGLGGLSVVSAIRRRLPHEALIYIADSRYAPYGEKTDTFIRARSLALAEWLVRQGAKALVVACNTATTHAIADLRERLAVPIIGVEPGIKPAVQASASKVVGVLATAATLRSDKLQQLLAAHGQACRFICQPGHGLVEQIEQGAADGAVVDTLLAQYLTPMVDAGADTLVLGSTHYAWLMPAIRRRFGDRLRLIETAAAIAQRVAQQLEQHGLAAPPRAGEAPMALCSTALSEDLRTPLARLAQDMLPPEGRVVGIEVGGAD
ncbi:MAG: glutamate racemase [Bordetella sp.]|nr:glutamate racemase [Bordetella sp.]